MQARERQLARLGIGLEHSEVGHDDGHAGAVQPELLARARAVALPDGRAEVELGHERARRLAQHHDRLTAGGGDLGRAAGARQAHLRVVVGADHGAVEVAVTVDLRGAQEADVDAPGLQPVAEDLGHRDDGVGGLGQLAVADRERQVLRLRADRAALVDQHALRRVRRAGEVGGAARQTDADEADRPVVQAPRGRDRHHLVGGVVPCRRRRSPGRHLRVDPGCAGTPGCRACRARGAASRRRTSRDRG